MKKVIKKRRLNESSVKDDLEYWLGLSPEERISAVEYLRKLHHGDSARFQRSVRIIQRTSG